MEQPKHHHGFVEVVDAATDEQVAFAVWLTDPYSGDWEWDILRGGDATRRKLDTMYEDNQGLTQINFRAIGQFPSFGWTSFEGLFNCLLRCLPAYGFGVGDVEFPEEISERAGKGDDDEGARERAAAEEAEVEEQFARQARLRRWENSGEKPPQTEV
jgi:hypothetical protein